MSYEKNDHDVEITLGELTVRARLNESACARKILDSLPIEGTLQTWGDEIYFEIPVEDKLEQGFTAEVVNIGDVAYWPKGKSFCVFFGPTPASRGGEIRPASAVNLIGKLLDDPK